MQRIEDLATSSPEQRLLVEAAARLVEFAHAVIDGGSDFAPLLEAVGRDGQRGVIGMAGLFREEVQSEVRRDLLRFMLREMGAVAYVMAVEGWSLPPEAAAGILIGEDGEPELACPISEDDRRISVLSLMGESVKGDCFMALMRIRGGAERRLMVEEPLALEISGPDDGGKLGGRMAGLLG